MAAPTTQLIQWEVRSGGASTNGGGFSPASTHFLTNGSISSSNTSSPVISSASYNFVAGDVGAWVFLQAGTNVIPGWYKIASVASNQATLTAALNTAILYIANQGPGPQNYVVGCGTASSLSSVTFGIDYSQQNSIESSISGVTTAAANAILLTSSASNNMLGNIIQITSGVNFTTGWYEVIAVSVGVSITVDRTATSAAGNSGVVKFGGALANLTSINGLVSPLQYIWVSGAFSNTVGETCNSLGSIYLPIFITGYSGNLRGDGYQGRSAIDNSLITTNFPTFTYTSNGRLTISSANNIVQCLNITSVANAATATLSTLTMHCKVSNTGAAQASTSTVAINGTNIFDCDILVVGPGAPPFNSSAAIVIGGNNKVIGNRIISLSTHAIVNTSTSSVVLGNTITSASGNGIQYSVPTPSITTVLFGNNTITNCLGHGISLAYNGSGTQPFLYNNAITDCSGYAIDFTSTINSGTAWVFNNRFARNGSGTVSLGGAFTIPSGSQFNNVMAIAGTISGDYVNYALGNYMTTVNNPGANVGIPFNTDIGALSPPTLQGHFFQGCAF